MMGMGRGDGCLGGVVGRGGAGEARRSRVIVMLLLKGGGGRRGEGRGLCEVVSIPASLWVLSCDVMWRGVVF